MEAFIYVLVIIIFLIGYGAIIFEHNIKVNKSASALLVAVVLWAMFFVFGKQPLDQNLDSLSHHISDISQILFFLMGAMTLVELVDSHKGFKIITDVIHTTSKRKLLWVIAIITFFLSSILDNLTTTILMVSLLRKIVTEREDRFLLSCIVIVAANAGGAWTPIGDVTTTMLWIKGHLSTWAVIKALFIPSVISLLVPLLIYTYGLKGRFQRPQETKESKQEEPGARVVFCLGVGGLVFVPIFKALTGLPPFMGVLIALGVLWLATDFMHFKHDERSHLRVPHILTRIDISGILFFLGILLCVDALQSAGILSDLAIWLNNQVHSLPLLATFIGIISAVVDNVPLVAATMKMYLLEQYPMDDTLWHMIAYAAGTGGSILIIGSSSGVALMNMEKIDFFSYMKKASIPVLIGYLAGMGAYLLLR